MEYFYQLKIQQYRKILDLQEYRKEIRKALMTIRGIKPKSIVIEEKYFSFKTSCDLTITEKQKMGEEISKNSERLREYITVYMKLVDGKIVISKCLFRHMSDAQIRKIKGQK